MNVKVIVFDLDDTLYEELTYVKSGFRAVASYLEQRYAIPKDLSYPFMLNELEQHGRGQVFNQVLVRHGMLTKRRVQECLQVYRRHLPDIHLYEDARQAIDDFSGCPIYVVTDGNKEVQLRKLLALGLYDHAHIRKCYISRRFGIHNEKPSPYCFMQICKREGVTPEQVVYVGDNPHKDFVGIKPLGFRTVRVMRGNFKDTRSLPFHEAEFEINNLAELWMLLENNGGVAK